MDWLAGAFRDCNGVSNGKGLPDDVIKLEAVFASIALASPSLGPVGPIIIGANGPVGGAGGAGGREWWSAEPASAPLGRLRTWPGGHGFERQLGGRVLAAWVAAL